MANLLDGRSKSEQSTIRELARQEIDRRRSENPLKYFVPNGSIERLIGAVADDRKDLYLLTAGNSVGKSAAAINIIGNLIWGAQSEWFNHGRFSVPWTYPKKFWYMSEQSTLKDFICGVDEAGESEIRKWFIPGRYEFTKSGYEYYSRIATDTGWTGAFKTYDMDPGKFESDKIGIAVFDEPPPKAIYNAVQARLTLGGIVIMPMTPLYSSAWVQDEISDKAAFDPSIYVFTADIEENCQEHGLRGRLAHSQIEKILSRYDPDELDARAHGVFMHLSGLIYRVLNQNTHYVEMPGRKPIQNDQHRIYCVCDPHDALPPMIAWFDVDEWQNVTCIGEFPSVPEFPPYHEIKRWTLSTPQICERIKAYEQSMGWNPHKITRVMDPNFGRKPVQVVGKTIAETYADGGRKCGWPLNFTTSVNDDLASGHQVVKDYLTPNADGDVRIRFLRPTCSNVWYSMTHYAWRPQSAKKTETDGLTEHVAHKFKHGADLVRYMLMYVRRVPPEKHEIKIVTLDDFVYKKVLPRIKKRALHRTKTWAQI